MFINVVFEEELIGCYDCDELATEVIETREGSIYLCKKCFKKLGKEIGDELMSEFKFHQFQPGICECDIEDHCCENCNYNKKSPSEEPCKSCMESYNGQRDICYWIEKLNIESTLKIKIENEKLKNLLQLAGKLAIAAEYVINNNDMLDLGNRLNYLNKCLNKYNIAIVQEVNDRNETKGE